MAAVVNLIPQQEMLEEGLFYAGFSNKVNIASNQSMRRFREWYGAGPRSLSALYYDIQLHAQPDVQHNIKYFFMALNWLTIYLKESVRAGTWGMSERTAREWTWFYAYAMQSLKA
jgi:hypothetical protein